MMKTDFQKFEAILTRAAMLTYHQKGTDWQELLSALFEELGKYPIEAIKTAVVNHVRNEKFFPMLSDIITGIEGTVEEKCALAWSHVVEAMKRFSGDTVKFPAPAYHYAIEKMGGWAMLPSMTDRDLPFKAKEFAQLFEIGLRVATWKDNGKIRVPEYLMCRRHIDDRRNGFLTDAPPVLNAITGERMQTKIAITGTKSELSAELQGMIAGTAEKMAAA